MCTHPLFYTLIGSWLPRFTHSGLCMLPCWPAALKRFTRMRCPEFSLRDYRCSYFLLFMSSPLIPYIRLHACSISLFIWYHVWTFICTVVAVILIHYSDYIACSGYSTLSVYTLDILLAYIRRRLSSRLRFRVFWEAERDRIFLVSEPGFRLATWLLTLSFRKRDLVLIGNLKQVIFILQCI